MPGSLQTNSTISHYRILQKLGAGGMGEVYLAQDTRLDRKVALKILPADVAADQIRMRRFVQEAKAASALNHPNIITIHEIGQLESVNFIATEFIDGETLRQRMRFRPMKLGEVLDVAIQCASALSAAHATGIVHRDIKPENIMIRLDGIVKVLDFGLAKLTERLSSDSVDTEAPTSFKTEPGTVVGTAIYMSPEQARGSEIDARTDIFSLGIVLYEMVSGRLPFEGPSTSEVLAALLSDKEPQPLARYSTDVPLELERIVSKALRKNREQRYQTVKDLLLDLQSLQQELEFQRKLERSASGLDTDFNSSDISRSVVPLVPIRRRGVVRLFGYSLQTRMALVMFAVVVTLFVGVALWIYWPRRTSPAPIKALAVLPFKPLGADGRDEVLELGMADTLIARLSTIPNIDVRPISAVHKYTALGQDPIAAGHEQRVDAVLEGHIQKAGAKVRVTVRLLRVNDGVQLWTDRFDAQMTDIFAVQDSISERVAAALAVTLIGSDKQRLIKHHTENAEAYQLYLKGRYHLNQLTDEGFLKGREYFQQAIDLDPAYALAYAGLADAYQLLSGYNALAPNDGFPKARAAATEALRLDEGLAEAHTVLGTVKLLHDWDWDGAEEEYRRALEINQSDSNAHLMYGLYLSAMGRFNEAHNEVRRAQQLDPLSIAKITGIGDVFYHQRNYDRAIEEYGRALELDPNSGVVHWSLGNAYVHKGMYDEAVTEYQKSIPLSGNSPDELASLGYAYSLSGKRREARAVIEELHQRSKRRYISPTIIAHIHAALGEKDEAFALLDRAYEGRDFILVFLKVDPIFDRLRSDARFTDLLHRMSFPQ